MMSMLFRMGIFVGDHLSVGLNLDPILALVGLASRRKEEHGTWHPSTLAVTPVSCTLHCMIPCVLVQLADITSELH